MMVMKSSEYVPSSVKRSSSGYNSLSETKKEVAVCRKVAILISQAILLVEDTDVKALHMRLMEYVQSMENLGHLTEAHLTPAKEFLQIM